MERMPPAPEPAKIPQPCIDFVGQMVEWLLNERRERAAREAAAKQSESPEDAQR